MKNHNKLQSFYLQNYTFITLFLLCLAKISGFIGIILGFFNKYHSLGGILLLIDGILLIFVVALCILNMRDQNKQNDINKQLIDKMLQDGSLQQQLQDYGFKIIKKV